MRRFAVLVVFAAAAAIVGTFACGPGSDKPPLTPDEHVDEAGAPVVPTAPPK